MLEKRVPIFKKINRNDKTTSILLGFTALQSGSPECPNYEKIGYLQVRNERNELVGKFLKNENNSGVKLYICQGKDGQDTAMNSE